MQVKALDFPLTTDSYRQFQLEQIGADIKETICRVSDGPFDAEQNASIPTVSYEVCTVPAVNICNVSIEEMHLRRTLDAVINVVP